MPMKEWIHQLQPVQLYVILTLSICYFIIQLFLSHITHALTLLIDSYHMLCNIIALTGCIITIKHSKRLKQLRQQKEKEVTKEETRFVEVCLDSKISVNPETDSRESKLHNTFGWTRIDILTMLIVCIFLASLSFSLLVEALQTLIHIDHQDAMHLPIPVFILGAMGLVLNGLCYLLIGGYTMHQGSFFHVTSSGDVILENITTGNDLKAASRRLSKTKREMNPDGFDDLGEPYFQPGQRQGPGEMFRDVCSTLFVMVCALVIYFADNQQIGKFIDPIMSILSCVLLLCLSYPYMKESCLILLQTIPGSIDIEVFKATLLEKFNEIVSVHDLHIWQLTSSKYVSTVHIIFRDPRIFASIIEDVKDFFHEQGITNVTIQPEFKDPKLTPAARDCYLQCSDVACADKHCCLRLAKPSDVIVVKDNMIMAPPNKDSRTNACNSIKSKSTLDIKCEHKLEELSVQNVLRKTVSESMLTNSKDNNKKEDKNKDLVSQSIGQVVEDELKTENYSENLGDK